MSRTGRIFTGIFVVLLVLLVHGDCATAVAGAEPQKARREQFPCFVMAPASTAEWHWARPPGLKKESQRLSAEIEQATGQPFRLQPEELRRLVEKASDMDPEQAREVSVLHPEDLEKLIKEIGSAQLRPTKAP